MRKYKIGITFNLETNIPDIWSNGANQNIIFFMICSNVPPL